MNVSVSDRYTVSDAVELYGLDHWAKGYLTIGKNGHLRVRPDVRNEAALDVAEVATSSSAGATRRRLLLRFPQLLEAQVRRLGQAFNKAIDEFEYANTYRPVFPIKVNHQRSVVERLLGAGREFGMGSKWAAGRS